MTNKGDRHFLDSDEGKKRGRLRQGARDGSLRNAPLHFVTLTWGARGNRIRPSLDDEFSACTAVSHTKDLLLKTGPFWGHWGSGVSVCEISWNISHTNTHAEAAR